ncbi:GFA family protein [Aquisalinus luteolus]|uniref:Uncharacterized protein n=1 Tax=Aquisalinus luteolus TaxID=1566827 RepID=A0A8J3A239_9PROT|nr:GFA family protein [Aquisalinus luteolus]GGH94452.1 hypothetical protein GCM10011355_08670 [Aquisalinus luteolus]
MHAMRRSAKYREILTVEGRAIERVSCELSLKAEKIQGFSGFSGRRSAIRSRERTEAQRVGRKFPVFCNREIETNIRETPFGDQGPVCIIGDAEPDMGGGKVRFLIVPCCGAIAATVIRRAQIGAALYPTDPVIGNKPPISLTNHVGVTNPPTCFTGICNRNSMLPGTLFLRAGTLLRSQGLVPLAHLWTKRKQPWINIPDDVPSFPESPTPEQLFAIISTAER